MKKAIFCLFLVVLAVPLVAEGDYNDQNQQGKLVATVTGDPSSVPAETEAYQPTPAPQPTASAPFWQSREGCEEAAKRVLRGDFALRNHTHPQYGRRPAAKAAYRITRAVQKPPSNKINLSTLNINSNNKNFNFAPPPAGAVKNEPTRTAPVPGKENGKKGMETVWIALIIVGAICATVYGCMYTVHKTEQQKIIAETRRINDAAERREGREATERERADAIERDKLAIVREAVGVQGKFSPENSSAGLVETRVPLDGVAVLTSRADNRPYSGQTSSLAAANANAAAGKKEMLDPNEAAAKGAAS